MIERCCAFTGHRPRKFPWGDNETDARCIALKKALAEEIAKLVLLPNKNIGNLVVMKESGDLIGRML